MVQFPGKFKFVSEFQFLAGRRKVKIFKKSSFHKMRFKYPPPGLEGGKWGRGGGI